MKEEMTSQEVASEINAYFKGGLKKLNYNQKKFTLGTDLRLESMPNGYNDKKDVKKIVGLVLAIADVVENNGGKNNIRISENASTKHRKNGLKKLRELVSG